MTFTCRTCKWWTSINGVCVCGYSGRPTVMEDSCEAWNTKGSDIDILIQSALNAGATVRIVKSGDGGFFVNGRKLSENDLEEIISNPKPMTNADTIRSMSDEELEEWLVKFVCSSAEPYESARKAMYKGDLVGWLREDARDEN